MAASVGGTLMNWNPRTRSIGRAAAVTSSATARRSADANHNHGQSEHASSRSSQCVRSRALLPAVPGACSMLAVAPAAPRAAARRWHPPGGGTLGLFAWRRAAVSRVSLSAVRGARTTHAQSRPRPSLERARSNRRRVPRRRRLAAIGCELLRGQVHYHIPEELLCVTGGSLGQVTPR